MAQANVLPLTAASTGSDPVVGYEVLLSAQCFPFLLDHRVRNSVVVPGTAFIEMAVAVGQELLHLTVPVLEEIVFHQALFLPEKGERLLRCMVRPGESGKRGFLIESRTPNNGARQAPWTAHVTGRFAANPATAAKNLAPLTQVRARCPEFVSPTEHYTSFEQRGFEFGEAFRGLVEAWRGDGEAVGKIDMPDILAGERPDYYFHPAMLDACLQVFAGALPLDLARVDDTFLPVAIERFCIRQLPGEQVWSHVRLRRANGPDHELLTADINIYSETGDLIAEVQGLQAKRLNRIAPCSIRQRVRDSLYEMVWEKYTPPAMVGSANINPAAPNRWLLLADKGGVAQALVACLAEQGQECHLLYALEPGAGDKSQERISDALTLHSEDAGLRGVVHLWSLDAELDERSTDIDFGVGMQSGCGTALQAIQAVVQTAHGRLWLVTRTAQACCNTDDVAPMAGALWGLGRVIAQEQPAHWGGLVDLDAMAAPTTITALANVLLSDTPRMGVAIRDTCLYVPRLQPLVISNEDDERMVLHTDRSYLITGGLGGVGRQLALWLAKQGAHHLTLLVRTPVASDPHHSATDARSRCLRELQALGVKVHIEVGDVSDAETMRALINRYGDTLPPLAGVVHAAGIVDDGVLTNQNAASFARVFAPKARGAWNLHRCTVDIRLDFFVLCSSLAAVLGSPGQANYAAANAWVDALAQHRHTHGMPACAINWGPWDDIGMMLGSDRQRLASIGIQALPPEDGCEAFALALIAAQHNLLAVDIDWQQFAASEMGRPWQAVIAGASRTTSVPQPAMPKDAGPRAGPLSALTRSQRDTQLQLLVQVEVARVLGLQDGAALDSREPLMNFGFESLMALRLKNNLEVEVGCALPATLVFDYPTIAGISHYLAQCLDQQSASEYAGAGLRRADDPGDDAVTMILAELERLSEVTLRCDERQSSSAVPVSSDSVRGAR